MAGLRAVGGDEIIAKRLAGSRPVLGICVGMQILFSEGVEHGLRTAGCGVLPGVVQQLTAPVLPHMGWNTVRPPDGSTLLAGIGEGTRFYFVHSYAVTAIPPPGHPAQDPPPRTGLTTHGEDFVATVEHGPLAATQFHPEKSAGAGAVLLANWLRTL
jgi:glutamine amidotransferase